MPTASLVAKLDREITEACLVRDMRTAYAKLLERRALEAQTARRVA